MSYGNDIDHVEIERQGVRVFANATTEACGEEIKYSTIFGYKLKRMSTKKASEILSAE